MYKLFFNLVFKRMDPERAHYTAFRWIRLAARTPVLRTFVAAYLAPRHKELRTEALGLRFHGPFGLAAGFDKNAVAIDGMSMLGFDHVEIGTVTGLPQPGNPKKRLFRLVPDRALINRMGFNNEAPRPSPPVWPPAPPSSAPSSASTSARPRSCRRPTPPPTTCCPPSAWPATPTTSWSTSPPRTPPACATSRPRSPCGRCSPPCARPRTARSPTAGSRCWSRSPPTSPTRTWTPSPTWRWSSASTASSPPTPPSRARASV